MALSLTIDTTQLKGVERNLERAQKLIGSMEFMDALAGLVESQTKRRIADEKTTPDGIPWKDWSKDYEKTRTKGVHSLLVDSGQLRDTIAGEAASDREFRVFTSMVYDGTQNEEREFLGLSRDNARELETLTLDLIRGEL